MKQQQEELEFDRRFTLNLVTGALTGPLTLQGTWPTTAVSAMPCGSFCLSHAVVLPTQGVETVSGIFMIFTEYWMLLGSHQESTNT